MGLVPQLGLQAAWEPAWPPRAALRAGEVPGLGPRPSVPAEAGVCACPQGRLEVPETAEAPGHGLSSGADV